MTTTTTTTIATLKKIFEEVGTSFVGLEILTVPATMAISPYHNKKGHSAVVYKRSKMTAFVMSGANAYERRVNTKIDKSLVAAFGDKDIQVEPFHAESLWGGAGKHGKGAIVHHVNKEGEIDKDYVFVYCDASANKPSVSYEDENGNAVDASMVIETNKSDKKTIDIGNGIAVEVTIKPRVIALENIVKLRIDGVEYEVADEPSVQDGGETSESKKQEIVAVAVV